MAGDYDNNDDPTMRLQPSASLSLTYAPSYTSVASDEIELVGAGDRSSRGPRKGAHFGGKFFKVGSRSWTSHKSEKSWVLLRRRLVSRVLLGFLTTGFLALLIFMSLLPREFTADHGTVCKPDGNFSLSFDSYTPWKRDGIFAINMRFGNFSFGQAKLIDVSWDIVIGRGGQAFLAIFTYVVFTKGLTRTMETTSVPHDTFKAITLQNDTFWGVLMLIRNFHRTGGRRAKGMMAWIITAACFVLLVPTWLSAMTGYVADIQPFVADSDNGMLPLSRYTPVIYTIHNGELLAGLKADARIDVPWGEDYTGQLDSSNTYDCYTSSYYNANFSVELDRLVFPHPIDIKCKWLWSVSFYTSQYGFFGLSGSGNTTFYQPNETNITTPVILTTPLDISAHFAISKSGNDSVSQLSDVMWKYYPYGMSWKDPRTGLFAFNPGSPLLWSSDTGTIFDVSEFNKNGICQQAGGEVRYQWGFSYLLLYIFVLCLFIWVIGMWIFYFDCLLSSRLHERNMGYERAVLDLSNSMHRTMEAKNVDLCSNEELQTLVADNKITYTDLPFDSSAPTRLENFRRDHSFKRWLKDEKWWLCAMLVFTLLFILSFLTPVYNGWCPYGGFIPGLGVFLLLLVGRETYGRWTVFAFFFAAFVGLDIWWIIHRRRRYYYYY